MWHTILGHERTLAQLQKALADRALPNAYLFTGISGIGKARIALIVAKALFCTSSNKPCGACLACQKIDHATHPDVHLLAPEKSDDEKKSAGNITIDEVRALSAKLQLYPLEGEHKLAILDDAHRLTESAANALLKILEEPPLATHFILITPFPHLILPTIRSRCRAVPFPPLPYKILIDWLEREHGYATADAQHIAQLSQGSLGRADRYDPELLATTVANFRAALNAPQPSALLALAEGWAREAKKAPLVLEILLNLYRDRLMHSVCGSAVGDSRPQRDREEEALLRISRAHRALESSANKQLLFEELLFTLARLERT